MKLDVKFVSENQIISSKFSQINDISDGGYERGYIEGKSKGIIEGVEQGKKEGYAVGYAEMKSISDAVLETIENELDAILALQKEFLPPQIITFTVTYWGNPFGTYEAIEGMTWGKWCESDYNPTRDLDFNKLYINEEFNAVYLNISLVRDENGIDQKSDTVLINGATYDAI